MQLFRWSRRGAVLALLLSGCRSEQAAFQFTPARQLAPVAVAPTPQAHPKPDSSLMPELAVRPVPTVVAGSRQVPKPRRMAIQAVAKQANPVRKQLFQVYRKSGATARRAPQQAAKRDTFHLVLGGLLVVAGVVAGLLLGGWLGLGVGAGVVILGYYFLVLGIGGQHAWLEIFQEFFNM